MGYTNEIGYRVSKVKVGVLIVVCKIGFLVVLVKLFLKRQLIRPKLNFPLVAIYSLILSLVHSVGSSSYRVLNSDLWTVAFLCFLTYILLVHRSIWSFLMYIQLQFLKIYSVKFQKSSLQAFYSLSSLKSQTLYFKVLNCTKLSMSIILILLKSILVPLPHFFYPSLTCCLMSVIVVSVITGEFM